jgi:arylsulfatase A-like enzyme
MKTLLLAMLASLPLAAKAPNVLVVITDDQGFGDFGAHGNPRLRTPNLDAFAKESVWLKHFYVCPVCSPTRSSLLTGQYHYRTGIVDTAYGRSMMRPDVSTLPETLAKKGYRTGLFGKWHLGDNYPMRPEDRGFQRTLWSRGGGLAQPSDPPGTDLAKAYFDPVLVKDGKDFTSKGYCTDVFTDAALEFISAKDEKPFFAYVAYNAPHSPFQVPEELVGPYRKLDLSEKGFPNLGQPWATAKMDVTQTAKAYAMIENIDTNFKRLMKALDERKIANDTIVVFLTDNGPGGIRFNSGLRNRKGTVYDGGIRVPCYLRYPARVKPFRFHHFPTMHIDIAPTIDALTGGPVDQKYDGRDLTRRLLQPTAKDEDPGRTIFTQWHRGDEPEMHRCFMANNGRHKLVQAAGSQENAKWKPKYELFDMSVDEFEQTDLSEKLPEVVTKLKGEYEAWFKDVTAKGFAVPLTIIGSAKENPLVLSRQNWRGDWKPETIGAWHLTAETAGKYKLTFHSRQKFERWSLGDSNSGTEASVEMELPAGPLTLKPVLSTGEKTFGPYHVTVELLK